MSEDKEARSPFQNEGEKQLTIMQSMLTRYKNKGLNPHATMEIEDCLMQANSEIRDKDAISPDTIKQMDNLIEKYGKNL